MKKITTLSIFFLVQSLFLYSAYSIGIPNPYEGMENFGLPKKSPTVGEKITLPLGKLESITQERRIVQEEETLPFVSESENEIEIIPLIEEESLDVWKEFEMVADDVKPEKKREETPPPPTQSPKEEEKDEEPLPPPKVIEPVVPVCPTTILEPENKENLPLSTEAVKMEEGAALPKVEKSSCDDGSCGEPPEQMKEEAALPKGEKSSCDEPPESKKEEVVLPQVETKSSCDDGSCGEPPELKKQEAITPQLEKKKSCESSSESKREEAALPKVEKSSCDDGSCDDPRDLMGKGAHNPQVEKINVTNEPQKPTLTKVETVPVNKSSNSSNSSNYVVPRPNDPCYYYTAPVSNQTYSPMESTVCPRPSDPCYYYTAPVSNQTYSPMESTVCPRPNDPCYYYTAPVSNQTYSPMESTVCPCQSPSYCCDSCSSWKDRDWSLEVRLGYFRPDSSLFREIYEGMKWDAEAELMTATCISCFRGWVNLNYLTKGGRSIPLHDRTTIRIATTSAGFKYFYNLCGDLDVYGGAGVALQLARINDRSPYVINPVSKNGVGLVAKAGFIYAFSECLFMDLFVDYYAQGILNFGENPRVERIPLDLGGLRTGLGVGIAF